MVCDVGERVAPKKKVFLCCGSRLCACVRALVVDYLLASCACMQERRTDCNDRGRSIRSTRGGARRAASTDGESDRKKKRKKIDPEGSRTQPQKEDNL